MRQLQHVEYKISLCHKRFSLVLLKNSISHFLALLDCVNRPIVTALDALSSGSELTFWETVKPTIRQINNKILWKGIYPPYRQSNFALIWCTCLKILMMHHFVRCFHLPYLPTAVMKQSVKVYWPLVSIKLDSPRLYDCHLHIPFIS